MKPFVPEALPPAEVDWLRLIPLIGLANRSIAGYAASLDALPNPDLLLSPLTTNEAVLSSKIEGTQATLGDVLKYEAGEEPAHQGRRDDIDEILNYRKTLRTAEAELERRPFSLNILEGLHGILLNGVRGRDKTPGRIRATQNWIGEPGSTLENAAFVPPDPLIVPEHLESWVRYYHSAQPDPIVQLSIVHAQFEIIHPFADGNGRLGRILIPLFLFEKRILTRPTFYLSSWLAEHRDEYVTRLRQIGTAPDGWTAWIEFFLTAVEGQARRDATTVRAIMELYHSLKARVVEATHSQFAGPLLDSLFRRPVFQPRHLDFGLRAPTRPAVGNLLRQLRAAGIIKELRRGSGRRATVYVFADLVNLCEGRKVF